MKNKLLEKAKIKQQILNYYENAPIKRWAAYSAGISEDTLSNWEKEDSDFSAHLKQLKAEYLRKRLSRAKNNEWVLERMFSEDFTKKGEIAITHRSDTDYIEFIEDTPKEK